MHALKKFAIFVTSEASHDGITCSQYNFYPILGVQFKCTKCRIDICGNCELTTQHSLHHSMLVMKFPATEKKFKDSDAQTDFD